MFSGILTEIYKDIRELIKQNQEQNQEVLEIKNAEIANASHQYEQIYRDRHGQVKVFCVGMREPIPLDDVYVAVQFLDDRSRLSYGSPEEVEMAFRERDRSHSVSNADERKDGTVVANEKQYLMLLGGPGVGKSTFLRKIGLEALKGKDGSFKHKCIPVFLELKRFTETQIDIEALITGEFEICGYPYPDRMTETALKSGKLLILFDGLDEVPTANVDNVVRKIEDFVDRYSQNRFIASCRVAAYKGGFTRFTEVEMAEFDDAQIETYIKYWFHSTPDPHQRKLDIQMKTAQQCWNRLSGTEHTATKELARNPLLLTLLCMVYDRSQNFPRNRAALYEDALNIFLKEWAAEKRIRREESISQYLDIADEKRMLSEIAKKNFEEDRLFFSKDELINQIQTFGDGDANTLPIFNASKILETILVDQGLFVERVRGSYSFSHLTFQEYLTANYIIGDTRSIQGVVSEHLHDEQWREVFFLIAGRMREADDLLLEMESEATQFINTDRLKALFRWTKRITDTTDTQYTGVAKRVFAMRQYVFLWLLDTIHEEISNGSHGDRNRAGVLNLNRDLNRVLNLNRDLNLQLDFYLYHQLYLHLNRDLDRELYLELCLELYLELYRNLSNNSNFVPDIDIYLDFYCYIENPNFYVQDSSGPIDWFATELSHRIGLVESIEAAKIFEGVDLQRIVQRFKTQREFIKAAREGKTVEPPKESIHDTWLSVLKITDEMLSMSHEELERCVQYLRAVKLIIDCKKAAGRVSPEVWNGIEERFLTLDALVSE